MGDIALDSPCSPSADLTIIDLNGHTISAQISSSVLFNVVNGSKLTLKGEGTISNKAGIATADGKGSEIKIENGTFNTGDVGFRAINGGKVVMDDGEITAVEGGIICPMLNSTIEINGGTFNISDNFAVADNGFEGRTGNKVTINGGTFNCSITTKNYEAVCIYVANSTELVINGGTFIANGGCGICQRAGNITINGGSIEAKASENRPAGSTGWVGDLKTEAGQMTQSAIIYHQKANYPGMQHDGMSLTINNGTFTGTAHALEILSNEAEPNVHVNGGTFQPDFPEAV